MFDESSAKYKKGTAHTKSRQTWNVWRIKPELLISPCQDDVSVAGQHGDSKQPKSSSKDKLRSQDRRERKLHTTTPFPPFRHPMPKPWKCSPMMFHPYAPWFGWHAPPMQYEAFYPRSVKHEQMHLIVHILEKTTSIQRVGWMHRKPRNNQTEQSSLGIQMFRFSQLELATHD
jgi:hypothetical protein